MVFASLPAIGEVASDGGDGEPEEAIAGNPMLLETEVTLAGFVASAGGAAVSEIC